MAGQPSCDLFNVIKIRSSGLLSFEVGVVDIAEDEGAGYRTIDPGPRAIP